jgi:hypothetical protein
MTDPAHPDLVPGAWVLIGRLEERPYLRELHAVVSDDQSLAESGETVVILDPLDDHHARLLRKYKGVDRTTPAEDLRSGWVVPSEHLVPARRSGGISGIGTGAMGMFGGF